MGYYDNNYGGYPNGQQQPMNYPYGQQSVINYSNYNLNDFDRRVGFNNKNDKTSVRKRVMSALVALIIGGTGCGLYQREKNDKTNDENNYVQPTPVYDDLVVESLEKNNLTIDEFIVNNSDITLFVGLNEVCVNEYFHFKDLLTNIIFSLKAGDIIRIIGTNSRNGLFLFECNGQYSYIDSSQFTNRFDKDENEDINNYVVSCIGITTNSVVFRREMSIKDSAAHKMSNGDKYVIGSGAEVDILGFYNGWYKINYRGKTGYIFGKFVKGNGHSDRKQSITQAIVTKDTRLCVLSDSDTLRCDLKAGDICEVVKSSGDSYYGYYEYKYYENGKECTKHVYGYVEKDSLELINELILAFDISDNKLTIYDENNRVVSSQVVTGISGLKINDVGEFSVLGKYVGECMECGIVKAAIVLDNGMKIYSTDENVNTNIDGVGVSQETLNYIYNQVPEDTKVVIHK